MRLTSIFLIIILHLPSLQGQQNNTITLNINKFEGLPSPIFINNIIVDENGVIWVASDQGLYFINPSLGTSELQLAKNDVKDLVFTQSEQWVALRNSIFILQTNEEIVLPNVTQINDLSFINRTIWAATDQGIFQIIPSTKKVKNFQVKNSKLKSNRVNFIHQDRHRIIWVGTDKGYIRIENEKWENEDEKFKMLLTYENNEGQWIISEDDLFLMNQFNRYFPVGIEDGLIEGNVKDFTIDSDGKLYVVSDIMVRYDPYEGDIDNFSENVTQFTSSCTSVERDFNNNIWIGTKNNGLFVIRFSDNTSSALYANLVISNKIDCPGNTNASLEAVVTGGLPPYTFEWKDTENSESIRSNLTAGTYAVLVSDQTGQQFKSTVIIPEPEPIKIISEEIINISDRNKKNGSIRVSASGGTGNLHFKWSNGNTKRFSDGLAAGSYSLTVLDSKGCQLVKQYNISQPKYIPQLATGSLNVGTTLRIEQLYFEADSTVLQSINYPILDEIFDFLVNNPSIKIEIGGHTNTIPPHAYCDRLSTERAKTVAYYLFDRGIDKERISYVGYGKRKPLTEDRTTAGRRKNQRVELKVIEI
jgi:outer membrane protein OmpA-like peptidoglycan-associated protein